MNRLKHALASTLGLIALLLPALAAVAAPDEKLPPDGIAYRPEPRAVINSLDAARSNLAELLSGKNGDVPGIRVASMPATCSDTTLETIRQLGLGGPSHATIACRQNQLLYAVYASIRVLPEGLQASNNVAVAFEDLLDTELRVRQIPISLAWLELTQAPYTPGVAGPDGRPVPVGVAQRPFGIILHNGASFHFQKLENAAAFADNLLYIQSAMRSAEAPQAARFEAALAQRRAGAKPTFTEEQRRLVVQANLMTQSKNYGAAFRLYQQALDLDPVAYPEAYLNSALLAGEMKRYRTAIQLMKKYLILLPGSKDARQAQDKIYEWELLGSTAAKP